MLIKKNFNYFIRSRQEKFKKNYFQLLWLKNNQHHGALSTSIKWNFRKLSWKFKTTTIFQQMPKSGYPYYLDCLRLNNRIVQHVYVSHSEPISWTWSIFRNHFWFQANHLAWLIYSAKDLNITNKLEWTQYS